jgi:hypothetical protein
VSGPGQRTAPPEEPYVLDGPAELERLRLLRIAHPDVVAGGGEFGTWRALIPEENGETVVVRYTLRELLGKLGQVASASVRRSGASVSRVRSPR